MVTDCSISKYPGCLKVWIHLPRTFFDAIQVREMHAPAEAESSSIWVKVIEQAGTRTIFITAEPPAAEPEIRGNL